MKTFWLFSLVSHMKVLSKFNDYREERELLASANVAKQLNRQINIHPISMNFLKQNGPKAQDGRNMVHFFLFSACVL